MKWTVTIIGCGMISGRSCFGTRRDAAVFADLDFLVIPTELSGTELLPVAMPEEYADRLAPFKQCSNASKELRERVWTKLKRKSLASLKDL